MKEQEQETEQSRTTEIRLEIEKRVKEYYEVVGSYHLDLSAEAGDYDLAYIAKKLAVCSNFLEKASDIQYEFVQIDLHVSNALQSQRAILQSRARELKASKGYQDCGRDSKGHWLAQKLQSVEKETENWTILAHLVLEVRRAVIDKIAMLKRLESSIRLQQKVLEAKVSSGGSPGGFKGTQVPEMDLS